MLCGLRAAGVERALMMPAGDGLTAGVERLLRAHASPTPELELLEQRLTGTAADTERAVAAICDAGARAIVVLGGDGTHRIVARNCGELPICALSTGTNNAFPEWRETTVAGLATGYYATGRGGPDALVREAALHVERDGAGDLALVDVAVSAERFVGARALWRPHELRELVRELRRPERGRSRRPGRDAATARAPRRPRACTCGSAATARSTSRSPRGSSRASASRASASWRRASASSSSPAARSRSTASARSSCGDGERAAVRLGDGPLRIDVDAVMAHVATRMQPAAL